MATQFVQIYSDITNNKTVPRGLLFDKSIRPKLAVNISCHKIRRQTIAYLQNTG